MSESKSESVPSLTLQRKDLPAIYRAASDASQAAQRRYQVANAAGLISLVLAAVAGQFTWRVGGADRAGVVAQAVELAASSGGAGVSVYDPSQSGKVSC